MTQRNIVETALRLWIERTNLEPDPRRLAMASEVRRLETAMAALAARIATLEGRPSDGEVAEAANRARRRIPTTEAEVREIRVLAAQGVPYREIARRLGRDHSLVIRILRREA